MQTTENVNSITVKMCASHTIMRSAAFRYIREEKTLRDIAKTHKKYTTLATLTEKKTDGWCRVRSIPSLIQNDRQFSIKTPFDGFAKSI